MSERFHLGDILSITTGLLVSPDHIAGVQRLLSFMAGEEIWTHALPRVADECAPELLRQHPDLRAVEPPEEFARPEDVGPWLDEQTRRFGEFRLVDPLQRDDHTSIDPLVEFGLVAPHVRVIPIIVDGEAS